MPDTSFVIHSEMILSQKDKNSTAPGLNHRILTERLTPLNNTGYYIKQIETEHLQTDLFISFNALSSIRKKIIATLNDSKEVIPPIDVPFLKKGKPFQQKPGLFVLISSQNDLHLCNGSSAGIYFK